MAGVIAPPPILFAAGFCAGLLLDRTLPRLPSGLTSGRITGTLLVAAGLGLAGWGFKTMQDTGTPVIPTQPTTRLVTTGPFRYTRNPGYAGMALLYIGLALLLNRLGPLLTLPGVFAALTRGVVEKEEAYLERKFGDQYRSYQAAVPRWLPD